MKKLEVRILSQLNKYIIPYEPEYDYDHSLTMCQRLVKNLPNGLTELQRQRVMLGRYEYKIVE